MFLLRFDPRCTYPWSIGAHTHTKARNTYRRRARVCCVNTYPAHRAGRTASTVGEEETASSTPPQRPQTVQEKWGPDPCQNAASKLSPGGLSAASTTTGTGACMPSRIRGAYAHFRQHILHSLIHACLTCLTHVCDFRRLLASPAISIQWHVVAYAATIGAKLSFWRVRWLWFSDTSCVHL